MKQTTIFGAPDLAPHADGSDTSEAAAASITPHLGALQARVMDSLFWHEGHLGTGLTCQEIEDDTDLKHQTVSARIWELKDLCQACGGRITYKKARRRCTCPKPRPYIKDRGERRGKQTVWRIVK